MRCCRSDWPGHFLFCCYQPVCCSQQSWFGLFCFINFPILPPPPPQVAHKSTTTQLTTDVASLKTNFERELSDVKSSLAAQQSAAVGGVFPITRVEKISLERVVYNTLFFCFLEHSSIFAIPALTPQGQVRPRPSEEHYGSGEAATITDHWSYHKDRQWDFY